MPGAVNGRAERFRETVIASAAEHGILRAEIAVHDFERGAHVVIEAAHQARLDFERDAAIGQIGLHRREVRLADFAEVVENRRQLFDDRLIFRNLAIEHAQRIGFDAALAIRAQLRCDGLQCFAQFLDILRAAILASPTELISSVKPVSPARVRISTTISITSASMNGDSEPMASAPIWKNWR